MEKIQKQLVTTLLEAIIEDGKAGISNAIQDMDVDMLDHEEEKIHYAVEELINLKKDEDGFSFYFLGKMLRNSLPGEESLASIIKVMLRFYEDVLNTGLDAEDGFGEGRTTFDFSDSEIKELVDAIDGRASKKSKEVYCMRKGFIS